MTIVNFDFDAKLDSIQRCHFTIIITLYPNLITRLSFKAF